MNLCAMTKEKLQFELPVVFTIGPDIEDTSENRDALTKYAMLLADSSNGHDSFEHIERIVKGIIEGETRVLVSAMSKCLKICLKTWHSVEAHQCRSSWNMSVLGSR